MAVAELMPDDALAGVIRIQQQMEADAGGTGLHINGRAAGLAVAVAAVTLAGCGETAPSSHHPVSDSTTPATYVGTRTPKAPKSQHQASQSGLRAAKDRLVNTSTAASPVKTSSGTSKTSTEIVSKNSTLQTSGTKEFEVEQGATDWGLGEDLSHEERISLQAAIKKIKDDNGGGDPLMHSRKEDLPVSLSGSPEVVSQVSGSVSSCSQQVSKGGKQIRITLAEGGTVYGVSTQYYKQNGITLEQEENDVNEASGIDQEAAANGKTVANQDRDLRIGQVLIVQTGNETSGSTPTAKAAKVVTKTKVSLTTNSTVKAAPVLTSPSGGVGVSAAAPTPAPAPAPAPAAAPTPPSNESTTAPATAAVIKTPDTKHKQKHNLHASLTTHNNKKHHADEHHKKAHHATHHSAHKPEGHHVDTSYVPKAGAVGGAEKSGNPNNKISVRVGYGLPSKQRRQLQEDILQASAKEKVRANLLAAGFYVENFMGGDTGGNDDTGGEVGDARWASPNTSSTSDTGAQGPAQFEPSAWASNKQNCDPSHPLSPDDARDAFCSMAKLYTALGAGDTDDEMKIRNAAAAYYGDHNPYGAYASNVWSVFSHLQRGESVSLQDLRGKPHHKAEAGSVHHNQTHSSPVAEHTAKVHHVGHSISKKLVNCSYTLSHHSFIKGTMEFAMCHGLNPSAAAGVAANLALRKSMTRPQIRNTILQLKTKSPNGTEDVEQELNKAHNPATAAVLYNYSFSPNPDEAAATGELGSIEDNAVNVDHKYAKKATWAIHSHNKAARAAAASANGDGETAINYAKTFQGIYYVWGGGHESSTYYHQVCPDPSHPSDNQPSGGPGAERGDPAGMSGNPSGCGVDCSGFVSQVEDRTHNINVQWTVAGIEEDPYHWKLLPSVTDAKPGDVDVMGSEHVEFADGYNPSTNTLYTLGSHESGQQVSVVTSHPSDWTAAYEFVNH